MSHAKHTVLDSLTIMKVAYGKDTHTSATDPDVKKVRQAVDRVREVLRPGAYLVDSIP